jgi:hypothetical protein
MTAASTTYEIACATRADLGALTRTVVPDGPEDSVIRA